MELTCDIFQMSIHILSYLCRVPQYISIYNYMGEAINDIDHLHSQPLLILRLIIVLVIGVLIIVFQKGSIVRVLTIHSILV